MNLSRSAAITGHGSGRAPANAGSGDETFSPQSNNDDRFSTIFAAVPEVTLSIYSP
jgi:hypothetical protein